MDYIMNPNDTNSNSTYPLPVVANGGDLQEDKELSDFERGIRTAKREILHLLKSHNLSPVIITEVQRL